MAHELSIVKNQVEMFYYGEVPWHGLGQSVDNVLTADEAIEAAHLNWEVEKREIFFQTGDGTFTKANGYCTVRTDENIPLGIVGKNYVPIQNAEAFSFMDTLVLSREAKYHTAGAIFQGAKVWILAKLPEQIIVKNDDVVDKYLLLVNQHDGKGALRVFFTPVRVVCQNTLNLALRNASIAVNIHHTGDVHRKIEEARRVLGIAITYFDNIEDKYRLLADTTLTTSALKDYVRTVFPGDSQRRANIRTKILELCEVGAGTDIIEPGTAWGAYNAVAEYVDHFRTSYARNPDRYLETVNFGSGAEIKTRAFQEAMKLAMN